MLLPRKKHSIRTSWAEVGQVASVTGEWAVKSQMAHTSPITMSSDHPHIHIEAPSLPPPLGRWGHYTKSLAINQRQIKFASASGSGSVRIRVRLSMKLCAALQSLGEMPCALCMCVCISSNCCCCCCCCCLLSSAAWTSKCRRAVRLI